MLLLLLAKGIRTVWKTKMSYLLSKALQKLASQYLKRDWPGINPDDQRTDYR